ncbi:MAG: hypothetical protein ACW981_05175 [Candidatus Hodarchaeales archaeon]|jgi:primosomal protein N'
MAEEDKSELAKELAEKVKNPDFDHTETTRTQSTVALKLKCQSCDHIEEVPSCDGQMMEILEDSNELKCEICSKTQPLSQHHDQPMRPFIIGA